VVAGLIERLERGRGMRAQRLFEGTLLLFAILAEDWRAAHVALALLAAQAVLTPLASPIAVAVALFERRIPEERLGDLYFDLAGSRGAAAISSLVLGGALLCARAGHPTLGRVLLAAPCASCILAATVGFCAGCGFFVIGRDLLARAGLARPTPDGAADVDLAPR
jgi:hypothetical protein